jgi:hypothetical protein
MLDLSCKVAYSHRYGKQGSKMTLKQTLAFMLFGDTPHKKNSKLVMTGPQWKKMVHEMYRQLPADQAKIAIDIVAEHQKLQ